MQAIRGPGDRPPLSCGMPGRTSFSHSQETALRSALAQSSARDRLLVLMGLHLGFRISEQLSVTVGQVWDGVKVRPSLQVVRAKMKGGAGMHRRNVTSRTVPIHPLVAAAIREYLAQRAKSGPPLRPGFPLFLSRQEGKALGRQQANRVLAAVIARAGFTADGRWASHSLRKTFAQRLYEISDHDIELTRAALGHRSIATTQRYIATTEAAAAAAILAIGPTADWVAA